MSGKYISTMAAASEMSDGQQRLQKLIECPMCLNELRDPRLLSCRHIYCYKCLTDYNKKRNHGNSLSCPQCREVTPLYKGGLDNLPKFFFMNDLEAVVMTKDTVRKDKAQKHRAVVCSTEDCDQPALKYCKQCELLCSQCYDDHRKSKFTKSHQVIPASEGGAFTKSRVEVTEAKVKVKEVSRIRLHTQCIGPLYGMVVYKQYVYVVHHSPLTVYCYTPDGSLSHLYEHKDREMASVYGMCLVKDGDTAMLVVTDRCNKSLIWISIIDDSTMEHHHTLKLDYSPRGLIYDRGVLLVCDVDNHMIHRYTHSGQTLAAIKLPDSIKPWWVARQGDIDQYIVSDGSNNQVVVINNKGQVKTRYNGDIHGVNVGWTSDVITDPDRGALIADYNHHQVLLLRRTGDVVKILDQHVRSPHSMYLDTDHHRLYVSGTDQQNVHHVFVFNYPQLEGSR